MTIIDEDTCGMTDEDMARAELREVAQLKGWDWVERNCRPDLVETVRELRGEERP